MDSWRFLRAYIYVYDLQKHTKTYKNVLNFIAYFEMYVAYTFMYAAYFLLYALNFGYFKSIR
jgi:Ni,Fe-hydrogenase I cytochrome b subunit